VRIDEGSADSQSTKLSEIGTATLRKVTLRLIPFLFVLYVVAWLDRVNVGFAALQMNSDLGFSSAAFGFGSGVFFVGYCLFEEGPLQHAWPWLPPACSVCDYRGASRAASAASCGPAGPSQMTN
jgi:hypothetical protein